MGSRTGDGERAAERLITRITRHLHAGETIYRLSDGRVQIQVQVSGHGTKRRYRRMATAATKENAETLILTWLRDTRACQQAGIDFDQSRQTLTTWLHYFLSTVVRISTKKQKTQADVRYLSEYLILPVLGSVPIVDITFEMCETWREDLLRDVLPNGKQRAPYTVKRAAALLNRALSAAHARGYILRNPAHGLSDFDAPNAEPSPLSIQEARKLLAVCDKYRIGLAVRAALTLGLRKGEAIGMDLNSIDWQFAEIEITQQITDPGSTFIVTTPKTLSSRRNLPLPIRLFRAFGAKVEQLHVERDDLGSEWIEHDLLCPNEYGRPLSPWNTTRAFKAMLRAAGLDSRYSFHDLRHTCGALLVAVGAHEAIRAAIFGHSGGTVTAGYSHAAVDVLRPWLDRVEELLYVGEVALEQSA